MEIRLLRTFKSVAEAGSFTQAASRVHLTHEEGALPNPMEVLSRALNKPRTLAYLQKMVAELSKAPGDFETPRDAAFRTGGLAVAREILRTLSEVAQ